MTTQYNIDKTTMGVNGFGLPFSDTIYTVTLAAATVETVTVPATSAMGMAGAENNKFIALFSYAPSSKVWVSSNNTAAVPAGGTFAASASELNPLAKYVKAGDILSFICAAGADVSVAFYAIQA